MGGVWQGVTQHRKHSLKISEDVRGPETKHRESLPFEPRRPDAVLIRAGRVLASGDFEDQLFLEAHKIDDVASDRRLSSEATAADLPLPDRVPEFSFRVGEVRP